MASVGSVYNPAERADALASKALKEGLRGAPLVALVIFLGLSLETGRTELRLPRRNLMLWGGFKSRDTADKAVKRLVASRYISYAGATSDGSLLYKLEIVHEPGHESFSSSSYLSVSILAQLVQHEAFYHKALGKHVLPTLQAIIAADGITFAELVDQGPYQRRTHKKHVDLLLEHSIAYEVDGKLYVDRDALEDTLTKVAQLKGTLCF